jgi:hypothetical protein
LSTPIDALEGLGVEKRDIKWLKKNGIKTAEALASMKPEELCSLPGFKSVGLWYCSILVEKARAFIEMRRGGELVKMLWFQAPRLSNVLEELLARPLLILVPTEFGDALTGEVIDYCVKLYAFSFERRTFETVAEKCYEGEEEAAKDFEESARIAKQRLGNLVCVQSVDGDCFSFFENLFST